MLRWAFGQREPRAADGGSLKGNMSKERADCEKNVAVTMFWCGQCLGTLHCDSA